jgi:hypothetical protein
MKGRNGIALRILWALATGPATGMTRGELRTQLGLPLDTEVCARIRELRKLIYGAFDVRVTHLTRTEYRYWLSLEDRARAMRFVSNLEKSA